MVAETLTAARGVPNFPTAAFAGAGVLQVAYGTYDIAANVEAGDIFEMCWLPGGAVVVGGFIHAGILDSNAGAETLDMDLGWAANGGSGTYDGVDLDGFGNFGVWKGDAFATGNINREATNQFSIGGAALVDGKLPFFTKRTKVQIYANAAAATFAAKSVSVAIFYVIDPKLAV